MAIRQIVNAERGDPNSDSVLAKAREITSGEPLIRKPYMSPYFGYIAQWVSEIAGSPDLDALLRHADTCLNPSWSRGGLYYPRRNELWDEEGNYVFGDPYIGNAAIGYARLNVKNGQRKMWEHAWTKQDVDTRLWIDGVTLGQAVDCLRGAWVDGDGGKEKRAMVATFRLWNGNRVSVRPVVKHLLPGTYGIYVDGARRGVETVESAGDEIAVELEVGETDVDLVVLMA